MKKKATKTQKIKPKTRGFPERIKALLKAEDRLYEKYQIRKDLLINFPKKKKVPFISKVALSIIKRQGGIIDARFTDLLPLPPKK